jgi:hypothetical protein
MDPLSELDYGTACYWAGMPPPGREAIDHLIAKQRYDLIGNVLRGYSPEGRLYALEAILTKGRESQSLLQRNCQTISRVVNLPTAINTCYGCLGGRHTAKEVEQITVLLKELGLQ